MAHTVNSLPLGHAAIGAVALAAGTLLAHLLGAMPEPPGLPHYVLSAVAGAVGVFLGGLIRRRRGKAD
jgi:hypothetical protein